MADDNYISTGKCIWCGRTIADGATFHNIPHVFPHALGGEDTCTDVCDDCNHYFGTTKTHGIPSIDLTFKEISMHIASSAIILTRIHTRNYVQRSFHITIVLVR